MYMQQTRNFTFNLNSPKKFNFDLLDNWLELALKIDIKDQKSSNVPMETLINRELLFIRSLMQAILLPYFDSGTLLKVKQNKKNHLKWSASVALVYIEHIPEVCYEIIINFAIKNIYWMMNSQVTDENREKLYERIEKEIIHKLKGVSGSGKSTIPILTTAYEKKIPFFHLGAGTYQLGYGSKLRLINRSTSDLDSSIGAKLSNDKMMTSNIIRIAGLPAPVNGVANSVENAIIIAKKIGWPVVVKPADADRGEGVTVGVTNDKQLKIAFEKAKRFSRSKRIIVEREVNGVAHRIFIAKGELIYAVKRLPISIEGDGVKEVCQLIKEANELTRSKPPWLRKKIFPDDKEALEVMKRSNYSLASIPEKEELVPLRIIESTASGGTPQNVTDIIHPDNIDIALRAVKLFGLEVSGVDIISDDITKPWHINGAIINEVNFAPAFGVSEISKSYIPTYLNLIIDDDGKIPISIILGGNRAMDVALQEQNVLMQKGISCFVSSHNVTINGLRKGVILPFKSLYKRCRALLMNSQVEAIILVVQTDEFLYSGLPCSHINKVTKVDTELISSKNLKIKVSQDRSEALLKLINGE
jgi:cyanophycin synthetase